MVKKNETESNERAGQPFIGRVSVGRRPIRKLPAPPPSSSRQAHVVKLGQSSQAIENARLKGRSLPSWPQKSSQNHQNGSAIKGGVENNKNQLATTYGRLSSFFRSVKFARASKKPHHHNSFGKVFGRDLRELYSVSGHEVPVSLIHCTKFIEEHAMVDGVYRISGIASNIKRLR